jgi:hypothetical protein
MAEVRHGWVKRLVRALVAAAATTWARSGHGGRERRAAAEGRAAAQRSLAKPWRPNEAGRRSVEDAVAFAKSRGVVIEHDIKVVARDGILRPDEDAAYAGFRSTKSYGWEELLIQGKLVVKLRPAVLDSDEAILDVLGHEMHEINALRAMFAERGRISGEELIALTEAGRPGNLHDQAWDAGGELVDRLRERGGGA